MRMRAEHVVKLSREYIKKGKMQKSVLPNNVLLAEVDRLIKDGEQVVIMTKGVSMLPFIRGGEDSAVLAMPGELRIGDIALAKANDHYVLHRIIDIDGDRIVLMGDGNVKGVERCRRADVVAVALSIIRKDGTTIDCNGRSHRTMAGIWRWMLPVRRWLLAIYRRIYRKNKTR